MATFAIGELLMILLLGGLLPNDSEPLAAEAILAGLPAECEVVAFQDFRGSFAAVQALVSDLSTQPWLVSNPEAAEGMREVSAMLSGAPGMASAMLGVDPFTAFHSASFCGRLSTNPAGEPAPSLLVVIQGDFPQTILPGVAAAAELGPLTLSNGTSAYGEREDGVLFGMLSPAPGVLLFGTEDLLLARAAGPLSREYETAAADSLMARVRELAGSGPRSILAFSPSAGTRFLLGSEGPVTFGQLVAGLDRAIWTNSGSSSYIETRATSADAFRDHELIVGGLAEAFEASSHAARGITQIVLGLLSPDDTDLDSELRIILSHREELLTFLERMGLFTDTEVTFTADAASQTTALTLDNSSGGVAVLGLFMGGAMTFMLGTRASDPYYEDSAPATSAPIAAPPAEVSP